MKVYRRMIAKLLALSVLLTMFGLNAHAGGVGAKNPFGVSTPDGIANEVVGASFESRRILLRDFTTETPYRVALSASITLLDGSKGSLEDVLLGDIVAIKLDSKTGDIRDLAVIAQH